jgi:short-subunit dehydrogenase
MPSYVVTGVSRGLGVSFTCPLPSRSKSVFYYQYEFLRQLSSDPENTVIGLVRDKPATDKKLPEELKGQLSKVHILQADITDYDTLKMSNYPLVVH